MTGRDVPGTLRRLARRLFDCPAAQERFIESLMAPISRPVAVVWLRERPGSAVFDTRPRPGWLPDYVDLVDISQRPGRHPLHEAGHIYCLDPSSVFAAQVFRSVPRPDRIVDVCAAPGGKSILAWRHFGGPDLLCNEIVGRRIGALVSNLRRCSIDSARVCSQDSSRLADRVGRSADLVIVDAPCSGQSLLARGKPAPGCFHPAVINRSANRQRRILAHSVRLVAPGGFLAYITCTYSLRENERNLDWLLRTHPHLTAVEVDDLSAFRSPWSDHACYRLWPFDSVGAGTFAALLKSRADGPADVWRDPPVVWPR